jgi:hypothetical protein
VVRASNRAGEARSSIEQLLEIGPEFRYLVADPAALVLVLVLAVRGTVVPVLQPVLLR